MTLGRTRRGQRSIYADEEERAAEGTGPRAADPQGWRRREAWEARGANLTPQAEAQLQPPRKAPIRNQRRENLAFIQ